MDEIIKEIIEIDKQASAKLEEANRIKDEVLKKQLERENEELRKKMRERAQKHLDEVRRTEQEYANEKCAEIEANKQKAFSALKKVYDENHQTWEDDLYSRVLGR